MAAIASEFRTLLGLHPSGIARMDYGFLENGIIGIIRTINSVEAIKLLLN